MTSHSRKPRSRTRGSSRAKQRRISVRGVRRAEPDVRKLARALIALALAQAEADAQADADARTRDDHDRGTATSKADGEVPDAR